MCNCFYVAISVLVGLPWGVVGVAFSYTIGQFVWVVIIQMLSNKVVEIQNIVFFSFLKNNFIFSVLMLCGMVLFKNMFIINNSIVMLLVNTALGIVLYGLCFYIFDRSFVYNKIIS